MLSNPTFLEARGCFPPAAEPPRKPLGVLLSTCCSGASFRPDHARRSGSAATRGPGTTFDAFETPDASFRIFIMSGKVVGISKSGQSAGV
jgi:hypothetical protein